MVLEYQAAKEREFVDLDFSNFDQINRLLDVLKGYLWEGWSYQISFALHIGFFEYFEPTYVQIGPMVWENRILKKEKTHKELRPF